jgi:hypothetical protein
VEGIGSPLAWEVGGGNEIHSPLAERRIRIMKPNARAAARVRPSRVQIALAAAWMILSLFIGGAVHADARADASPAPAVADSLRD